MTQNYQETFDRLSLYFLAILISPILFGVFLAFFLMISSQDSWSFGPTVLVVALYSLPFFAFVVLPASSYIDFSTRTKNYSNWVKALLYAGFGGLVGLLACVVLYDLFSIILMFIFGMSGGVIHFFTVALLKKFIK